ncbi:MAG: TMEM165/GDT1 family protein [Promethearchaeia archaeon]
MSLEHEKPYKVAIGSILGFGLIITLGVVLGEIITSFIPVSLITTISGIIFILLGLIGIKELKPRVSRFKAGKREGYGIRNPGPDP